MSQRGCMTPRLIAAVLLLPLALGAGCTRSGPPTPFGGGTQQQATRNAPSVPAGQTIVVAAGDTVHGLAQRYRVTTRDLIAANDLAPPYRLRAGQTLRLPVGREHTVKGGETLYEISRRYGVDMHRLAHLNSLTPPYTLSHGQRLRLPGDGTPTAVAAVPEPARPSPLGTPDRAAGNRGAGRVTVEPIQAPLAPAMPAQPQPGRTPAQSSPPAVDQSEKVEATPAAPMPVAQPTEAAPHPVDPAPTREVRVATPAANNDPPPRTSGRFLWPVRGRVISDFGPKAGGLHNDGINIAVPRGEPVRAAESGVVVYAGSELKGFGNLLLIRHADGWITAYGHNDALLVGRGDSVNRGQIVARAGATGNVNSPQVHFELRRGTRAVDPRGHLGAQTAAAN